MTLGNDILASEQRDEAHKVSLEQFQRVTEKDRRQLVIDQGDLAQQQALANNQHSLGKDLNLIWKKVGH